jgi:Ca2+-binding EF-hand superfamily protein
MIDTNRSKTIDKEETLQFWGKNFPKLNTNELFSQVDRNNDGTIQLDEWIDFWILVLKSGHTVEEVSQEVF